MNPAYRGWHVWHTRVALSLTGLATAAGMLFAPSVETQVAILAVGVALIGMPHGAADHLVLGSRPAPQQLASFSCVYLALALAVLVLWWVAPQAGLAVFLACSAFHFGATDTARRGSRMATVAIALRGTTPIALPATFHPEAYAQVLAWVLDDAGTAATWSRTLGIVGGLAGSLLAGLALTPLRAEADLDRFAARVELLAIGVAAAALPPIAFFALYFCCWHAFRHALQFCERIDPEAPTRALGTIARRGAGNTLLCLTAVAIGAWMWSALDGVTEALVRVVFLGLAALTVPHLLLTAQPRQKVDRTSQRVVRTPLPSG